LRKYSFAKKLQSQNVSREKLCKALLYKKGWSIMLMKLIPLVNFINIYEQLLRQYFCAKKFQSQSVIIEKLTKILLNKKVAHKTMMKLTPCCSCSARPTFVVMYAQHSLSLSLFGFSINKTPGIKRT